MKTDGIYLVLHNSIVLNLKMAVAKLKLVYFRFKIVENKMTEPTKPYNIAHNNAINC